MNISEGGRRIGDEDIAVEAHVRKIVGSGIIDSGAGLVAADVETELA